MTNYNERLTTELVKLQGRAIKDWDSDLAKAKQALTSLIKELVAEARIDELKQLAEFQLTGGIKVFGRHDRSYYDRIAELKAQQEEV